jgi:hypothetical protein
MINRVLFIWTITAVLHSLCMLQVRADSIGMVTGSQTGTYFFPFCPGYRPGGAAGWSGNPGQGL